MKQKIKNIFKKPTKKALGKLGLFLIFGFFAMNINFYCKNEINKDTAVYFGNFVYAAEEWWLKDFAKQSLNATVQFFTDPKGYREDAKKAAGSLVASAASGVADVAIYGIDEVVKYFVGALGGFIDSVLKQEFFDTLVGKNENVYKGWTIVRDMLNMFFMFLLLFSAFATIFQVEKYHLRKVIIMLIVMALLVNFSFPITAFIIDFSNSAMYFLLELTFGGSTSSTAKLAEVFSYGHVLASVANKGGITTTSALLTLIFDFIMMVTFIALLINLLIRILAFMILMILSPAGFVFAFFPDTKSIASKWWSALFKYAFLGPIMAFFLYLAVLIFSNTGTSVNLTFAGSVIAFLVPITFLWMGLIFSQQFGGEGSGVAMNIAKRGRQLSTRLSWAGTKLLGRGLDNVTGGHVGGTWGAVRNRWNQFGDDYKRKVDRRSAEIGGNIGVRDAREKLVRERLKVMEDEGISNEELNRLQTEGTMAEQMAVALFRAKNNRFDDDPVVALRQYTASMNAVRDHQVYRTQFLANARKTNMDLVINESINNAGTNDQNEIRQIIRGELQRLDPDQWKDQNIVRMVHNRTPNRGIIIAEGANVISGYSQQGQDNVTKNMRGLKLEAGSQSRNNNVGFWA
ncbi:MAG: type IV secretion system protein [Candidatus Moranbacteria bacterium]|nr:type IV secretion system protein [Candidatus Moranbacteria bacterium]